MDDWSYCSASLAPTLPTSVHIPSREKEKKTATRRSSPRAMKPESTKNVQNKGGKGKQAMHKECSCISERVSCVGCILASSTRTEEDTQNKSKSKSSAVSIYWDASRRGATEDDQQDTVALKAPRDNASKDNVSVYWDVSRREGTKEDDNAKV